MSHEKYKLSKEAIKILSPLVDLELSQSSIYVQVANRCNRLGYLTAEQYFLAESKEERDHALIHYDYITGRGSDFIMPAIDKPDPVEGKDLYEITEYVLEMEDMVSKAYGEASAKMFGVCQMTYSHLLQFQKIQQDALKFYIDACAVLFELDKTGQLVAEKNIFKG